MSYRYDAQSKLIEKAFANGVKTTYSYNGRGLLESLVHSNNDGIINEFAYTYDLLGNKTRVDKKRNTLHNENGSYEYGYDSIGRLHTVEKDGSPLRTYNYDAYGNRTSVEDYSVSPTSTGTTHYEYNSLNQLITKTDSAGVERYSYDRRGNLSAISLNGAIKNTYVYGAINRLEQATNAKEEIAKYLYNGLGNRVSRQIGTVPAGTLRPAELAILSPVDFHPERRVDYIVDLTREYNNLLTKSEGGESINYAFDTGLLLKGEEIFLADELTSPVGRIGRNDDVLVHAAYDEFGIELGGHVDDDFTFTGYMRDAVANTYFAQVREYAPETARFVGRDIVAGYDSYPFSLNQYTYCFNNPLIFVDFEGAWPKFISDIGNGLKQAGSWVAEHKSDIIKVGVTSLAIAGTITAGVLTGGAALVIVGTAAGVGALSGGVSSKLTGGSFANGFVGGAVDGAIAGSLPGVGGVFLGGVAGSVTTDVLDNIDRSGTHSVKEITGRALLSGALHVAIAGPFAEGARFASLAENTSMLEDLMLTLVGGASFGFGASLSSAALLNKSKCPIGD